MLRQSDNPRRGAAWQTKLGFVVVALGVLLLTPASDLLPVQLWLYLQHPLKPWPSGYIQTVPSGSSSQLPVFAIAGIALILIGLGLAASGKLFRRAS